MNTAQQQEISFQDEMESRRWRHRRKIAYMMTIALFLEVIGIFVLAASGHAGSLAEFNSLLITVVAGQVSVVGAYMGLATWKEVAK
jgi:uncharacterized membrane protein